MTGIRQNHTNPYRLQIQARISRLVVIICICLLLLHQTLYALILSPRGPDFGLFLIQAVPLLVMLPGIARGRLRTYQWICFLILLYFTNAVLNIFTPGSALKGTLEAIYCVLLFSSAIVFVNSSGKSAAIAAKDNHHDQ